MMKKELHFSTASAPHTEYLILEAYIGNEMIADLQNINGIWEVSFVVAGKPGERWDDISWEIFTQVHQKFADFVEEMKSYPA